MADRSANGKAGELLAFGIPLSDASHCDD